MNRNLPQKRKSLVRAVRELNEEGSLALFLGAGISKGCGLPDWNELMIALVEGLWRDDPLLLDLVKRKSEIHAARYARKRAGVRLNHLIQERLYRDPVNISGVVHSIASSGIRRICTFNYDDLLEEAFMTAGITPKVVSLGESYRFIPSQTTIFHPHGFIGRFDSRKELETRDILLSEDDYNNLYSDPYSWANLVQIGLLTTHSILFIGISFSDPNLRRLIDVTRRNGFRNQHFAIFRDPTCNCARPERPY